MIGTSTYLGLLLVCAVLLIGNAANAQEDYLFKITRNKDANEVLYHLNYNDRGELNVNEPIAGYWLRYEEGGRSRLLNGLERRYAYGLKFLKSDGNKTWFQFVSYAKKDFYLMRDQKGGYGVYGDFVDGPVKIHTIFLHLSGGTFWIPKISQVDIHGTDQQGDNIVKSIVNP